METEERIACRTPTEGRDGVTRIPAWKYHAVRRAILHAVEGAGPEGLPFSELTGAVRARLSAGDLARLGALGWHCTTVKLELEVAGEIARLPGSGPQRLVRGGA
ncbi:hypothetical protein N8I71_01520 [Roseibacterium sp. SDUM158016]|uniref:DUF6958 family protein n=1 Tax=Roseicyclus sediminis TaxID=2980997 RepID=UPI0021CEB1E0|nr:hypothetical protein [Roseibacterium sp. SDUM158016]MCU4651491.1 hypothetical protein [Roseibacterium sp. SDUM158016]